MKHIVTATTAFLLIVLFGSTGYAAALTPTNSPLNHPQVHLKNGTSTNWSGYAAASNLTNPVTNAVSNVQGSWIVPTVICSRSTTYSSMWVGIDGYSDSTVEQTGTEQDCNRRMPSYYAWYELYPQYMIRTNLSVSPGNSMTGSVQFSGLDSYTLTLTNNTTGRTFTTTQQLSSAKRESAEWIAEAPSSNFGVLPLSNFGTAHFTSASATLNGLTGPINDTAWQNDSLTMELNQYIPKATPSALSSTGNSFFVAWNHN